MTSPFSVGDEVTIQVKPIVSVITSQYGVKTYSGKILPNPRWVDDDSFCISTGDTQFPFRIIELARVVGLSLPSASVKQKKTETFIVSGSKGSSYTVTRDGSHWSCTCVGFGFRKDCKHVRECKST